MPDDRGLPLADTVHAGDVFVAGVEFARGASVGRYLVLEKLGEGGMGVVYAAYDSKLDRRVALKALRGQENELHASAGQSRLFREAQAMARLSHPNVVTVYDVIAEEGQVLVAMELVEGQTLSAWLDEKKRGWREIVFAFVQAGRGLAAAHEAGIVHRDFKVDNVFVGKDGRPRVGDFGLARVAASVRPGPLSPLPPAPSHVSAEGIAGTPAYMAMHQLLGAAADEQSDQFSFCVALYEALYGEHPFDGTTLSRRISSMDGGRVRAPRNDKGVPSRLRAMLARGLEKDPSDRFPSMRALLAALEADPSGSWRRYAVVGGLALSALAFGVVMMRARRAESLACRATGAGVDDAWNDQQRKTVREAFERSGRPYAEDTYARTARLLDAYVGAWSQGATAACERGADDKVLASQRAHCFGDKLEDLRALVGVLGGADGDVVDHAVQAARALPDVAVCGGKDPGRGHAWPSDPAVRIDAEALERQLSAITALREAGRYTEGKDLALQAVTEAERVGFAPLKADAYLALGQAQWAAGLATDAEGSLHRAAVAGEVAGSGTVAGSAWMALAAAATEHNDFALADERLDLAGAYIDRLGTDEILRAKLLVVRGDRLSDEGRAKEARPLHEKALGVFEALGSDQAIGALNSLGIDADLEERYDEARAYYERALAGYAQLLGPDHPKLAQELGNLAITAGENEHYGEAVEDLERALRIVEKALGPDEPSIAVTLYNLAFAYDDAKRYEDAVTVARRAIAAVQKGFSPDSVDMAFAKESLAEGLMGLHRSAEAVPLLEGALAIRLRGGVAFDIAQVRRVLGKALFDAGREPDRARALLAQARETFVELNKTKDIRDVDEFLRDLPASSH